MSRNPTPTKKGPGRRPKHAPSGPRTTQGQGLGSIGQYDKQMSLFLQGEGERPARKEER